VRSRAGRRSPECTDIPQRKYAIGHDRLRRTGVHLRFARHVHLHGHGDTASRGDLISGGLSGVERQIGDAGLRAFAREFGGDFLPDAACCAGDQRDLVFE
jgi:hypothetical protein